MRSDKLLCFSHFNCDHIILFFSVQYYFFILFIRQQNHSPKSNRMNYDLNTLFSLLDVMYVLCVCGVIESIRSGVTYTNDIIYWFGVKRYRFMGIFLSISPVLLSNMPIMPFRNHIKGWKISDLWMVIDLWITNRINFCVIVDKWLA